VDASQVGGFNPTSAPVVIVPSLLSTGWLHRNSF